MKVHKIFKEKFKSIRDLERQILKSYPDDINDRKIRGNIFEDFILIYFNVFKDFYNLKYIFRNRDNEIPTRFKNKFNISGDYGVDGICVTNENKSYAWQSKFIKDRSPPSYEDITKLYHQGRKCDFHYIISNAKKLTKSKIYFENPRHKQILYDKFLELDEFDWENIYNFANNHKVKKKNYKPNPFQKKIINNVVKGFEVHNRGKLIAACGTGKTLLSIWINEKLLNTNKIMFVVPNLMLLRQTVKNWVNHSNKKYDYLAFSSDSKIQRDIEDDEFEIDDKQIDLDIKNPEELKKILKKKDKKFAIFTTYQSLKKVKTILDTTNVSLDLIIFDEAHRTAGTKLNENFSLALNERNFRSKKRLFMTATERFVTKRTKKIADKRGLNVFSMDDPTIYGPTFAKLSFGEAIKEKLISDYKILVAEITEEQLYETISSNDLVDIKDLKNEDENISSTTKKIAHQILLFQAIENFKIRKIVSFHSNVQRAKDFIYSEKEIDNLSLEDIFKNSSIKKDLINYKFTNLNAKDHTSEERNIILDETFNNNELGVISNAKCLTEGIDVPIIDSIFFADPKNSLIDIVQACGRALRKPYKEKDHKTSYFIVPIIIPKNLNYDEAIDEENNSTLYSLIQSLRDIDSRIEDWTDMISLNSTLNKKSQKSGPVDPGPIIFLPNNKIDISKFQEKLILKISENNSLPSPVFRETVNYGRGERKAPNVKWGPIADYSTESLKRLLLKTLNEFGKNKIASKDDLNWQHNAISHTLRMGLIKKINDEDNFKITNIGEKLMKTPNSFIDIFKKELTQYNIPIGDNRNFKPYITIIEALKKINYLNFHEFAFCFYNLKGSTNDVIKQSTERIKYFRNTINRIDNKLSEKNRNIILENLNKNFGTNFSNADIWGTTTVKNKFIYFRRHLVDSGICKELNNSIVLNI